MEIKGIPEHGLELLSRENPAFDQLAVVALRGQRPPGYTDLEPFAVILRNNTEKYVVGYAVRWEFTQPNGQRVHWDHTQSQATFLLDRGLHKRDVVTARKGPLVPPHSFRFMTPEHNLGPDSELPQWTTNESYLSHRAAQLAVGADLQISLDGAFFDDGTFVGPNQSGYFELFKAEVDTKQELFDKVMSEIAAGKRVEQVLDDVEASLPTQDPGLSEPLIPATFAQYYRRRHAEELIGIRKAAGARAAVDHARRERFVRRPNLTRADK